MFGSADCNHLEQQLAIELKQAKSAWNEARSALCQVSPSPGVAPSDAITRVQSARQLERSAAVDYAAALKRFSRFIMDGQVP